MHSTEKYTPETDSKSANAQKGTASKQPREVSSKV